MEEKLNEILEALKDYSKDSIVLIPRENNRKTEYVIKSLKNIKNLLVTGGAGTGKTYFIHQTLSTLISRNTKDEIKFLLFDPKCVALTKYKDSPYLLSPIIKDNNKDEIVKAFTKLLEILNERLESKKSYDELTPLVVVIDEYADIAYNKVKELLYKLLEKCSDVNIHFIIATQNYLERMLDDKLRGLVEELKFN